MKRFGRGPDLIDAFRENCAYASRAGLLAKHICGFGELQEHQVELPPRKKNELSLLTLSIAAWCLFEASPVLEKVGSPLVLCKEIWR